MAVVSEDGITNIIIMRRLYVIEQDHVFQLDRIADDTVRTDQCGAPDEGAVAHFRFRTDNAGSAEIGRRENSGRLMDPDMLGDLFIAVVQCRTELQDKILDPLQCFPGVGELL